MLLQTAAGEAFFYLSSIAERDGRTASRRGHSTPLEMGAG